MENIFNNQRRTFLKLSVLAGYGLTVSCKSGIEYTNKPVNAFQPNAWLIIDSDNSTTIVVSESEMGQGVFTSLAMLVADELEADWARVSVQQAPVVQAFGWQGTGGSSSIRQGWKPLREAGAAARMMLQAAAARRWKVPFESCQAVQGEIVHTQSGRRASYGDLVALAAREPVPVTIQLKESTAFRLLGKPLPRLDTPTKVNGQAIFGADVRRPGMLSAAIRQCPVFGGKPGRVESSSVLGLSGVRHVVSLESAVAVVAESWWQASQALQRLPVEWDFGANATQSSEKISQQLRDGLKQKGTVLQSIDTGNSTIRIARQLDVVYETPYQAHATMEPMCCTAEVEGDLCTVWAPTQQPSGLQREIARLLSGQREPTKDALNRVVVHTTLLGGGFGRRNLHDFALQAVQIARQVKRPVQLVWSREEDMQHGFYHPATMHRLRAGLDVQGRIIRWDHRFAGVSYGKGAEALPYRVDGQRLESTKINTGIPLGPWRSVSHAYHAYVVECFIDELAKAAGQDAVAFRSHRMRDPRLRAVLELAAEKAGWGKRRPKGRHLGVAAHSSFGSHVAEVVELSVMRGGKLRVHRVTCIIDCGMVVNPDTVVAQMEGSVVYALTAALKGAITIRGGYVEQSNFDDYPLLRMEESPAIEVHIIPSQAEPGGVGEPGVPPLAPALANAVFAATGKRVRHLPIKASDLH